VNAVDWFLIGWLALGTLVSIGQIGKPRKPLEAGTVVLVTIINAAIVVWILMSGGVLS
jgi:hypothetical protein